MKVSSEFFLPAQAANPATLTTLLTRLQPDVQRYARRQCHLSPSRKYSNAMLSRQVEFSNRHLPLCLILQRQGC